MKIFLHLPKTGGTTIVNILSQQILFHQFQRINPTWDTHPKEFLASVDSRIAAALDNPKVKAIGGHFGFAAHSSLINHSDYFTVLRDPIDRVISEYYYMKHNKMYYQEMIQAEDLSMQEYVAHPEIHYLNNLQTRLISGVGFDQGDEVTEEMYLIALDNLKRFATFGITERMADTLALFYLTFDWNRLPMYIQSNANAKRPQRSSFTAEEIALISDREHYDIMLYDEALKLFQIQIDHNIDQIERLKSKILKPPYGYSLYLKALGKVSRRINY